MTQLVAIAKVVLPILICAALGIFARKKEILSAEHNVGIQRFVLKFCVPCVLFNSCLDAAVTSQTLLSMALLIPLLVVCFVVSLRLRKKALPYHSLPLLLTAHETGMLGIPLFMILFGADQAYRMGILDLTQAVIAFPVIAILSADDGNNPSAGIIVKKVLSSPLMIMSFLGLALNISGIGAWMENIGIRGIITETTTFLSTPVSALMIFSVGYNLSLSGENRKEVMKLCLVRLLIFAVIGGVLQLLLFLIPGITPLTRWAMLLYCFLPASYIAPSLGKTKQEQAVAAGVSSLLTIVTLAVFCAIAALTA